MKDPPQLARNKLYDTSTQGWYIGKDPEPYIKDVESGIIPPERNNKFYPLTEFLKFDSPVKDEAMVKKLKEFNNQVPTELQVDVSILEQLPSLSTSSSPDPSLIPALSILISWPEEQVFPAIDLIRSALLNPGSQPILLEKSFFDKFLSVCMKYIDMKKPQTCQMLVLRALCNVFWCEQGEQLMRDNLDMVVQKAQDDLFHVDGPYIKNVEIAASTLMLNYSICLVKKWETSDAMKHIYMTLAMIFCECVQDWEARFRIMVAFGCLLTTSLECKAYGRAMDTRADIKRQWKVFVKGPPKAQECAKFVLRALGPITSEKYLEPLAYD